MVILNTKELKLTDQIAHITTELSNWTCKENKEIARRIKKKIVFLYTYVWLMINKVALHSL